MITITTINFSLLLRRIEIHFLILISKTAFTATKANPKNIRTPAGLCSRASLKFNLKALNRLLVRPQKRHGMPANLLNKQATPPVRRSYKPNGNI